jgi:hypothetical protein
MDQMNEESSAKEWKEAKPIRGEKGPIWGFRRGYTVKEAGRHESSDQFAVFQKYIMLQGSRDFAKLSSVTGHASSTLSNWCATFNWERRAAAFDKQQMAIVWNQADKLQKNSHKEAIVEFRESSERQARMMAQVSEDLLRVMSNRIAKAEEEGEDVPMALVSGLLRAAANISEQSRQSWANSLGINEMMEMVEAEMERVQVEDITEIDAYDIPLDE